MARSPLLLSVFNNGVALAHAEVGSGHWPVILDIHMCIVHWLFVKYFEILERGYGIGRVWHVFIVLLCACPRLPSHLLLQLSLAARIADHVNGVYETQQFDLPLTFGGCARLR